MTENDWTKFNFLENFCQFLSNFCHVFDHFVGLALKGFNTNSLLSLFFVILLKPKARIKFSVNWWSSNKKCFFLFIASQALLQNYAEIDSLSWGNFPTCHSCPYYSFVHILILPFSGLITKFWGSRVRWAFIHLYNCLVTRSRSSKVFIYNLNVKFDTT